LCRSQIALRVGKICFWSRNKECKYIDCSLTRDLLCARSKSVRYSCALLEEKRGSQSEPRVTELSSLRCRSITTLGRGRLDLFKPRYLSRVRDGGMLRCLRSSIEPREARIVHRAEERRQIPREGTPCPEGWISSDLSV